MSLECGVHQYTAYIDEAGDEGFGKLAAGPIGGQSQWLLLGACLVSRENDLSFLLGAIKLLRASHSKRRAIYILEISNTNRKLLFAKNCRNFRLVRQLPFLIK